VGRNVSGDLWGRGGGQGTGGVSHRWSQSCVLPAMVVLPVSSNADANDQGTPKPHIRPLRRRQLLRDLYYEILAMKAAMPTPVDNQHRGSRLRCRLQLTATAAGEASRQRPAQDGARSTLGAAH